MSEKIRHHEKDLQKMNDTLKRLTSGGKQAVNSTEVEKLRKRIEDSTKVLNNLRSQERKMSNERSNERSKKKMTLF